MPLKTPAFWQEKGWQAKLLLPLSWIYLLGHKIRTKLAKPYTSRLPVLCIGGVVAGGSGKTPATHAVIAFIREHGIFNNPVILTRGYGGKLKGPTIVDPIVHSAADIGDESFIHSAHAPTIVSRNRAAGARLAEAMGADIIIMDDGLQNTSLTKTASILVLGSIGNGYMLPAGPLREPLKDALSKAAMIFETADTHMYFGQPSTKTVLQIISSHDLSKSYVGFAGLGNPEKFERTLIENGFHVRDFISFPDHHPYSESDLKKLTEVAGSATLITTEKDSVRLPASFQAEVLQVSMAFEKPQEIINLLKSLS